MNNFGKLIVKIGLISLLSVMPLAAQIEKGVDFTTSFPFYAGNARMPAGSYKITASGFDTSVPMIKSKDGAYSAFVDFIPTDAEQPHPRTDVTFHKYGDTDFLNGIWVVGQHYGMKVDPTKLETATAANTNVVEHSLVADKRWGEIRATCDARFEARLPSSPSQPSCALPLVSSPPVQIRQGPNP